MAETLTRKRIALLSIVAFLSVFSYASHAAVARIMASWQQEEYSHGIFIPLITLILLLNAMKAAPVTARNSWLGLLVFAGLVTVQYLLEFGGIAALLPDIYLLALIAAFITFWGVSAAWRFAGPLGFLLFCAPLPNFFYYPVSFQLQMLSTWLGAVMLDMLSIPVFREGNIIDLGGYKLQVAEACSGLRYIFPLLSLSYLFAYLYKGSPLKRVLLCLSSIPIAVVMNALRIALIGVTVSRWGGSMAEGPLHEFEGIAVFLGCALCLLAEVFLFQRVGRKAAITMTSLAWPGRGAFIPPAFGLPAYIAFVLVILAAVTVTIRPATAIIPVPLKQSFAAFPLQIKEWTGHMGHVDATQLDKLGTEDYLLADYTRSTSAPVNLYILYYPAQDSSSNEAVHNPAVCIPAGGWAVVSETRKPVTLTGGGEVEVNKIVIAKDMARQIVYYWFLQQGHSSASTLDTRLHALRNALMTGHTNGAMVRIVTRVDVGETEAMAEERMQHFIEESRPQIERYLFDNASH